MHSRERHVVAIFGGLGNQLFQYCWAQHLTESSGYRSVLDTSGLRSGPRTLGLQHLGLDVTRRELRPMRYVPFVGGRVDVVARAVRQVLGPTNIVRERAPGAVYNVMRPSWWYGYWQSRDTVLSVLEGLRAVVAVPVMQSNSIGVHVRRGDYVPLELHLNAAYFEHAVREMATAHPGVAGVVVYSDDPMWCRKNLHFDLPTTIAHAAHPADDLIALAASEYLVLSRGTFGWWASHLVERVPATVIVPDPYLPGSPNQQRRLADPSWWSQPAT